MAQAIGHSVATTIKKKSAVLISNPHLSVMGSETFVQQNLSVII